MQVRQTVMSALESASLTALSEISPNLVLVFAAPAYFADPAFAATLAMCLPMSILIYLLIDRWESFSGRRWQKAVSLGVAPLAVGLIFSGATLIAQAAAFGWAPWLLVAATLVANLRTKLHPLWLIAVGAGLGLLGWV